VSSKYRCDECQGRGVAYVCTSLTSDRRSCAKCEGTGLLPCDPERYERVQTSEGKLKWARKAGKW
jgi:DnaJ-class molecular chaperone